MTTTRFEGKTDCWSNNHPLLKVMQNGTPVGFIQYQMSGDTVVVLAYEHNGDNDNANRKQLELALIEHVRQERPHIHHTIWLDNANVWA
nr:hypothetical protein [uncultured Arsenicibacter sp.]